MEAKLPPILLVVLKRIIREGLYTKIITDDNKGQYEELLKQLDPDEKGLVVYYKHERDWLLLTQYRLIATTNDRHVNLLYTDFYIDIDHFMAGVVKGKKHETFAIKDRLDNSYIFEIEPGYPTARIMEFLMFLIRRANYKKGL